MLPSYLYTQPSHPLHAPTKPGHFSIIYSTTASGPFSTCNPCGSAIVLIPGFVSCAIAKILALSSGVHIDAQNCFRQHSP